MDDNSVLYIAIGVIAFTSIILIGMIVYQIISKQVTYEGTFVGTCIDKYTSQSGGSSGYVHDGNGYSSGYVKTNFFLTFKTNKNKRMVLGCGEATYGKIIVGDRVKMKYQVLRNGDYKVDKFTIIED